MKDTPKRKRKNAKTWPKSNQNNPIRQHRRYASLSRARSRDVTYQNVNKPLKQHRRYASLSRTGSRDVIRQNINKPPKQHHQGAVLSKTESHNLIGHEINKVSCFPSVSQKNKHVKVRGRQLLKQKISKTKLQETEVSHGKKSTKRFDTIRHKHLKSIGHETSPKRDLPKIKPSRLIVPSKVRNPKKDTDFKISKNNICLKRVALLGTKMGGEENKKPHKQRKDSKRKPKSSKPKQDKKVDIDPVAFSRAVEQANILVKSRKNGKPLKREDIEKHFAAIEATVHRTNTPKAPPTTVREVQESEAPEGTGPEGSNNYSTGTCKRG